MPVVDFNLSDSEVVTMLIITPFFKQFSLVIG